MNLASDSDGCEIHQSGEGGIACLVIGGDVSHVLQPDHRRFGRDIKGIGDIADQPGAVDQILQQRVAGVLVCHQLHRTFGHEDGGGEVVCLPLHPVMVSPQFPVTLFAAGVHSTLDHGCHGHIKHTRLIGVVGKVAGVEYVMATLVTEGKAVAVLLVFLQQPRIDNDRVGLGADVLSSPCLL